MAPRTQEERDAKRKTLFEKEHIALQQAEAHWAKAGTAWQAKNTFLAQQRECKAREAESRAARYRSHHEMLNWEEDREDDKGFDPDKGDFSILSDGDDGEDMLADLNDGDNDEETP
jgi:hypothetical protein